MDDRQIETLHKILLQGTIGYPEELSCVYHSITGKRINLDGALLLRLFQQFPINAFSYGNGKFYITLTECYDLDLDQQDNEQIDDQQDYDYPEQVDDQQDYDYPEQVDDQLDFDLPEQDQFDSEYLHRADTEPSASGDQTVPDSYGRDDEGSDLEAADSDSTHPSAWDRPGPSSRPDYDTDRQSDAQKKQKALQISERCLKMIEQERSLYRRFEEWNVDLKDIRTIRAQASNDQQILEVLADHIDNQLSLGVTNPAKKSKKKRNRKK